MRDDFPPDVRATAILSPELADEVGRLPKNVKPLHYNIVLDTDLENASYIGSVDILLDVLHDTRTIVLHNVGLHITSAAVRLDAGNGPTVVPVVTSQELDETTMFTLASVLPSCHNQVILSVSFSGSLAGNLSGFYRGAYKTESGVERYYAVTQMQPCEARRALPCFDEPALKATFDVTLMVPRGSDLKLLSNMDAKRHFIKYPGGKQGVTFNTTPLMSTYLLAFGIGDFNSIQVDSFRVPIRLYTTPDRDVEDGRYAAELTAKALAFYEEKFGAEYPLPKLDLLGVAAKGGAMENWGLIMFQDSKLLTNKSTASAIAKVLISDVILHEEAHLWFGDLVTMEWWEGLWLNESFATWVSWYALNAFNPEWQIWNDYVTDSLQQALTLDSLRGSHPIEVPVATSGQINQVFDAISYAKGSSVLRMLSTYLGEDVFIDGVRRYIKAHAYSNTKTSDLWEGLSEASGEHVAGLMQSWTKKVGFPVVTVTEDDRVNLIHVKQNRFLRRGKAQKEDDVVLWPIPLALKTRGGIEAKLLLTAREGHLQLPNLEFFKINGDHTGVYRTLYTPDRLMKLALSAKSGLLSAADRAGLMADSAALSISGYQLSSVTFYFAQALLVDSSYYVWKQIMQWFNDLHQAWMFESAEVKAALDAAQRQFSSHKAHSLGWDFGDPNDSDTDSDSDIIENRFKALMFVSAGYSGDEKVVTAAREMFSAFFATGGDKRDLNPNLRAAVFGIVLRHTTGIEEYELVLREYRAGKTTEERGAAMSGLGHAVTVDAVQRSISLAFDEAVPFLDLQPLLLSLRTHRPGVEALYSVVMDRWQDVRKRAPSGIGGLTQLVPWLTAGLATEEQAQRLEDIFEKRDTRGLDKQLGQEIEEIRVKAGWLSRSSADVEGWLRREGYLKGDDTE